MARLYFLKIMSSNNKKTILDEKKCVGRKNEKMKETMTPNWFLFSLFTFTTTLATIHNITTDLGDLLPTAPHKISFSDPHWATPNLCLGLLIFQRRASDGQIFQQAFFFRLLKKSWVFFRIPPRTLLWAQVPFSEDFEPSIFHVKNWSFAHQCDGHTSKHHCTWKLVLMALVTLFKISSWLLPGSCPAPVLPNLKKKLLPKFLFIIATFSLIIHNLIVQMSFNHAFSWYFSLPRVALRVKLRMMNVSKNSI